MIKQENNMIKLVFRIFIFSLMFLPLLAFVIFMLHQYCCTAPSSIVLSSDVMMLKKYAKNKPILICYFKGMDPSRGVIQLKTSAATVEPQMDFSIFSCYGPDYELPSSLQYLKSPTP